MRAIRRIAQTELSRDLPSALEAVHRGETLLVESDGRDQAAIVDPLDLQLLKAAVRYFVEHPEIDVEAGLPAARLDGLGQQGRLDVVLGHYLAGSLSLSRAAELLALPWIELRSRFARLGIPVATGPLDAEGLSEDLLVAESALP